jgi:uncharacterized membrane protein
MRHHGWAVHEESVLALTLAPFMPWMGTSPCLGLGLAATRTAGRNRARDPGMSG